MPSSLDCKFSCKHTHIHKLTLRPITQVGVKQCHTMLPSNIVHHEEYLKLGQT